MGSWAEQPLTAQQRERNWLWLNALAASPVGWGRDRWGPASSHVDPTPGDQWFDRQTGRAWVYSDEPDQSSQVSR